MVLMVSRKFHAEASGTPNLPVTELWRKIVLYLLKYPSGIRMSSAMMFRGCARRTAMKSAAAYSRAGLASRYASGKAQTLKSRFAEIMPAEVEKIKKLRAEKGSTSIGEVTVDMVGYFEYECG